MWITRRRFLGSTAAIAVAGFTGCAPGSRQARSPTGAGEWVNDIHSQINRTHVAGVQHPRDPRELARLIAAAHAGRASVSICGGRHAGGGQQFLHDRTLIDLASLNRVSNFDPNRGTVEIEAGARWPTVLAELSRLQDGRMVWSIHQKQGGADQLSIGGAIASNVHGRCLRSRPFVQDVLSMRIVLPDGETISCSRDVNPEHFQRVIGGYGLFGVVASMTLRLERRQKLVRRVVSINVEDAIPTLHARRDEGASHGDFQFSIDSSSDDFCTAGLCSWYPVAPDDAPVTVADPAALREQSRRLAVLAHQDPRRAMSFYRSAMLASDGKAVDWSDEWQRGGYEPGYHTFVDQAIPGAGRGSEILSELYVPRSALPDYLRAAAGILREDGARLIYGVVRLIERDDETALAWARQPYACVIFNLHTRLEPAAIEKNAATFRRLLDAAIARGGSYYLTYHRFARPDQTMKCYPAFSEFLAAKARLDPRLTLASDWHEHYRTVNSLERGLQL